jgi:hypothetical protein
MHGTRIGGISLMDRQVMGATPSEQICFGVLRRKGTRFSSPGHGHRILIDEVKGVGESATIMLDLRKASMVGGATDSL